MPHPKLGEEVAAAVVLREGAQATERELQDFVGKRAADFKVPKRIFQVAELPRNAMGKVQKAELRKRYAGTFS
jgi:acyl-coenzyme A synthetase/AMP-(fatty) acid ligase